jgi:hypothetical protein
MTLSRAIPLHVHGALEVIAAPLLLVAPFVLGFGFVAGAISIALGAALIGLALSIYGDEERGSVPLNAHVGLDYVIASVTIALGIAVGIATGNAVAAVFMVGFGVAHMALIASTRFSRPVGA